MFGPCQSTSLRFACRARPDPIYPDRAACRHSTPSHDRTGLQQSICSRWVLACMPLKSIVVVVLRLFAIQTLLQAIGLAVGEAGLHGRYDVPPRDYSGFIAPGGLLVFATIEWLLAPAVAKLVTRRHDTEVSLGALSRADLYSFAFVFLGLYFILSSIAPALIWLHYSLTMSAVGSSSESERSFYALATPLIGLIAGFMALLPAQRWARRLLTAEGKRDRPQQASPGNSGTV